MRKKLRPYFDPETEFETEILSGEPLKETFATLHEALVAQTIQETETLGLHPRVKQAASEAAGLAWTTGFPLLVFPALFQEKVHRARREQEKAQRIKAETAELMELAV